MVEGWNEYKRPWHHMVTSRPMGRDLHLHTNRCKSSCTCKPTKPTSNMVISYSIAVNQEQRGMMITYMRNRRGEVMILEIQADNSLDELQEWRPWAPILRSCP